MHYLTLPYLGIFFSLMFLMFVPSSQSLKKVAYIYFVAIAVAIIGFVLYMQPVAGDPYRYKEFFDYIRVLNFHEMLISQRSEFLYRLFNWTVGQFTDNFGVLLILLYSFFFIGLYKALDVIYGDNNDKFLLLASIILYPYVLAYFESAKRQGIALVLMLLSIAYVMKGNNYKWILFLIPIPFIHSGSLLVLPVIILFYFLKDKPYIFKLSLIIYFFTLFLAITNINKHIIDLIPQYFNLNQSHQEYFMQNGEFARIHYKVGFRIDFTLFSIFPLLLYFIFPSKNKRVVLWLSLYLLLNSLFNFFCAIPFSDRIAEFSWFIWPIVVFEILKSYKKTYSYVFILIMFFSGIVLLQFYTSKYFLPLNLY